MPMTTREALAERRVNLADWVTAVMSIFWSVWWGFFMNRVLDSQQDIITSSVPYVRPKKWLEIPMPHFLIANVLIVSFFAHAYVCWLWDAQKTAYSSFLVRALLRSSLPLIFSMFLLLSSISLAGLSCQIPEALISYGFLLTVIWPAVVLVTLWRG